VTGLSTPLRASAGTVEKSEIAEEEERERWRKRDEQAEEAWRKLNQESALDQYRPK
jgi:hypothetical protein